MKDLFGYDKISVTLDRLKQFEPAEGYFLAFSGGKDSIVLKALADMAGVKYDAHMSLVSVDPPELIRYVKAYYPDVVLEKPPRSIFQLIYDKCMLPTRKNRWCCAELKERYGVNRLVMTGIRSQESAARKKRQMIEPCYNDPRKRFFHPIIDWTYEEIWAFITKNMIFYCSLYDKGFERIGCIGCPMSSKRKFEFKYFPKFYNAYMKTIEKMLENPKKKDKSKTAKEIMDWWLADRGKPDPSQGGLFT